MVKIDEILRNASSLGLIGLEQCAVAVTADDFAKLPAYSMMGIRVNQCLKHMRRVISISILTKIVCILHTDIHTLPCLGRVRVDRVTRQKDALAE